MQGKYSRWRWILVIALTIVAVATLVSAEEKPVPEDNIALVNGVAITKAEFDRGMARVQRQLTGMGRPLGDSHLAKMQEDVLVSLIESELLYQESQKEGIKIDEAAIDEQLAAVKKRFPDEAEFQEALNEQNVFEADIRSDFRRGKAVEQLIDEKVVSKISVSDEETMGYYDQNLNLFKQPEQVQASHILIKADPDADESQKAQAREELEGIRRKLQEGEDFAALAKEFSQGPSSTKGGDLGYFGRGQMVKPFEEAAFALEPGEVSDIVQTRFGYHLIKVTDKKAESAIPYDDVKDRLEQYLKQRKIQKEVSLYVEGLKAKAELERFVAEDS